MQETTATAKAHREVSTRRIEELEGSIGQLQRDAATHAQQSGKREAELQETVEAETREAGQAHRRAAAMEVRLQNCCKCCMVAVTFHAVCVLGF